MCQSSVVSRSLEPNSGLACTEGCLCHAVLREPREEPFEGPLPDLVVDRCSVVFLQDCVAVNPLARELVCDKLPKPNRNSKRDTAVGDCRDFGQAPDVANVPLKRCCVQLVRVVDDFSFQWVPFSSDSGIGNFEVLQKGQHQDGVAHDIPVVHVPLIRKASVPLQRVPRVMSTGSLAT